MANSPTERPEPEIIPPDRKRQDGTSGIWVSIDDGARHRIHIARPGPFTALLMALLIGLIGVAVAVLFLGTVLIVVPAIIVVVAFLIAASMLRRHFGGGRRPR